MTNLLSKIKVGSFFVFFIFSLYNYFGPEKNSLSESSFDAIQILGFLIFFFASGFSDLIKNKLSYKIDLLFLLFFISLIISSIISLNLLSIAYSIIFFINFILITSLFKEKKQHINLVLNALTVTLVLTLFIQFLLYGVDFGFGRNVGNFKPNQYGIIGLSIIALGLFSINNKIIRLLLIISGLFFATIVVSRGAIFSILIFLILYQFNKIILQKKSSEILNYFILTAICLPILYFFVIQFQYIFNSIFTFLELIDSKRGLDSGFTGRDILWKNALDYFQNKPILGYGLRNLEARTHNGYILLLLETGLSGIMLFLIAILKTVYLSFKNLKNKYSDQINIALSYILTMLIYSLIERSLFLFSSPNSLTFFFFIAFVHSLNFYKNENNFYK